MAPPRSDYLLSQLDVLEAEGIHIVREVAAEFERPVLLFSGGKDSVVVLHLAAKAFWPGRVPFPVLHVDTGHNFPEVLAFRDATVEESDEDKPGVILDYAADGELVGMEILNASTRTDNPRALDFAVLAAS